jgi:FAD/FMN-containing dehydrogenase
MTGCAGRRPGARSPGSKFHLTLVYTGDPFAKSRSLQKLRAHLMKALATQKLRSPSDNDLNHLVEIVGNKNAIREEAAMAPFLIEWRDRYVGKAALVLKPSTPEQVAEILSFANERRIGIVPQGGNTGLVGGQIPFETGDEVVVSTTRLNRIRVLEPDSGTMTAEAGVILENARRAADEVDRLFPLSLASEGSCQIGGNLATNAGGTAVLAYGNVRNLVLGIEVVLANGEIWDGLRALEKDNTGYDLKDLFIGSEGTLGLITAAVLKLFPKPAEQATAFIGFANLKQVAKFFSLARNGAASIMTAFELIPRLGVEFVIRHGTNARDPLQSAFPWYVLIELSGSEADGAIETRLEALLSQALQSNLIEDAALATSQAQAQELWSLRELLSEVQKPEGGSIKHDVSVPVGSIPDFIERAQELVKRIVPGSRPVPFGHFGDGNIHFNVSQPVEMDKADFLAKWDAIISAVHELVASFDGSVSAEHGIGRMKRALLAETKSDVELGLMRKVKQALDPNGIMNPGKLL